MKPLLSALMPCFNSARHASQAIESVLAQSFEAFEFLILDDGSTDGTADIIHAGAVNDIETPRVS